MIPNPKANNMEKRLKYQNSALRERPLKACRREPVQVILANLRAYKDAQKERRVA
jgi:hypothetical protein